MPYFIPTQERIDHLINTFGQGAEQEAMITDRNYGRSQCYITELEEIGPTYIMDDLGNAIVVTWDMFAQCGYIYPPLAVLT